MAFTVQQLNSTTRLLQALKALKADYYQALEDKEAAALIGIPLPADFPPPGDLDHVTLARLRNAHGVVNALRTFLTTPIVLAAQLPEKAPLDAIVEVLR